MTVTTQDQAAAEGSFDGSGGSARGNMHLANPPNDTRGIIEGYAKQEADVALATPWLVSAKIRTLFGAKIDDSRFADSRGELEHLGFSISGSVERNGLRFYTVTPPMHWTRSTEGRLTSFMDHKGRVCMTQHFSSAHENAFVDIQLPT